MQIRRSSDSDVHAQDQISVYFKIRTELCRYKTAKRMSCFPEISLPLQCFVPREWGKDSHIKRTGVLELVPLTSEKNSSHAHKIGSWYLLGVLVKISDEHPPFPRPSYMGVHRGPLLMFRTYFDGQDALIAQECSKR